MSPLGAAISDLGRRGLAVSIYPARADFPDKYLMRQGLDPKEAMSVVVLDMDRQAAGGTRGIAPDASDEALLAALDQAAESWE